MTKSEKPAKTTKTVKAKKAIRENVESLEVLTDAKGNVTYQINCAVLPKDFLDVFVAACNEYRVNRVNNVEKSINDEIVLCFALLGRFTPTQAEDLLAGRVSIMLNA